MIAPTPREKDPLVQVLWDRRDVSMFAADRAGLVWCGARQGRCQLSVGVCLCLGPIIVAKFRTIIYCDILIASTSVEHLRPTVNCHQASLPAQQCPRPARRALVPCRDGGTRFNRLFGPDSDTPLGWGGQAWVSRPTLNRQVATLGTLLRHIDNTTASII